MPTSPPQEGVAENKPQDELEENGQAPGAEVEGGEHSFHSFRFILRRVTRLTQESDAINISPAAESSAAPVKRGRGRPKGSKNKKGAPSVGDASTSAEVPKKKRGRPPKVMYNSAFFFLFQFMVSRSFPSSLSAFLQSLRRRNRRKQALMVNPLPNGSVVVLPRSPNPRIPNPRTHPKQMAA